MVEVRFGRDLTPSEWRGYRQTIEQGKKQLGIDKLCLISPLRSLPSASQDPGMGSPATAKPFWQFLTQLGFDTVQIDPTGKTKLSDPSPYGSTAFSRSPLYLDLALLATKAWGTLLKQEMVDAILAKNPHKDGSRVAYKHVYQAYDKALDQIYSNFDIARKSPGLRSSDPKRYKVIQALQKKLDAYVEKNTAWLEPDSLYEALSKKYGNDYWAHWEGPWADIDKNLFNVRNVNQKRLAQQRIRFLKTKYDSSIGAYQFAQFLLAEQQEDFKRFAKEQKLNFVADIPVGLSNRDVWANQSLFLEGYALGCPPDYFSKDGQTWGFPVLDPGKLFNPDGSLGPAGEFLKRIVEKAFQDAPGGVRIDHIIGLIDPWVYPKQDATTRRGARLFSSPEHPIFKQYAKVGNAALNQEQNPDHADRIRPDALDDEIVSRYAQILDKIILPVAQANGVPRSAIICEDLGTLTTPVKAVLEKRGLSGIRVTQFVDPNNPEHLYRGKNVPPQHWITPGTHDNRPTLWWSEKLGKKAARMHARNLADDLLPNTAARPSFVQALVSDRAALTRAKFIEAFTSPARYVQIFFADWLGMKQTYNRPGTVGPLNWSLRIPKNYREAYFKTLNSGRGLNLPEVMAKALAADSSSEKKNPSLIKRLHRYAAILSE